MTNFDHTRKSSQIQLDLKTALVFSFWIILAGPLTLLFLWAAIEGFSMPWGKFENRYVVILVHFLCYTPPFAAGSVTIRNWDLRQNWLVVGVGSAVLAISSALFAVGILIALGVESKQDWPKSLMKSTCAGVGVTVLVLAFGRLYHSGVTNRIEAQRRIVERERAHRAAAEAQWNSLESRVHPHFLFNTLSSIRELMHRDLAEADLMIQRFATLIRFSLDSSRNALVPLAEELQIVTHYLEIEKMRLGSRLTYQLTMAPECAVFKVPALSVLTLAENSVKHAVACRRSGGLVEISAQIDSGRVRIEVCDDGAGFDESGILPGHGLDLLLKRLESLYQSDIASLSLPVAGGPARVTLLIPTGVGARSGE